MREVDETNRYRRFTVVSASLAASLGVAPGLLLTHGEHVLSFVCIAAQAVLVTFAISFLAKWKQSRQRPASQRN